MDERVDYIKRDKTQLKSNQLTYSIKLYYNAYIN